MDAFKARNRCSIYFKASSRYLTEHLIPPPLSPRNEIVRISLKENHSSIFKEHSEPQKASEDQRFHLIGNFKFYRVHLVQLNFLI